MTDLKTVLITGATAGLGLALATQYNSRDYRLILVGRRSLDTLSNPLFSSETYCQADLSLPDAADKISSFLDAQGIHEIDLLIQNAGVGYYGGVGEQSADNLNTLLTVNLWTPIALTRKLAARVREKIVFISSVSVAMPAADYATYAASKAALDGFVRALHVEAQVPVQLIHPGAALTSMHEKIGMDEAQYKKFESAASVAKKIAAAIDGNRYEATISTMPKLIRHVGTIFPKTLGALMTKDKGKGRVDGGKTAVITGAADGIGRAIALRFAQAGYDILAVDVDAEKSDLLKQAVEKLGVTCAVVLADLLTADGIADTVAAIQAHGKVSVLVNNAGISAIGRFLDTDLAQQKRVYDLNLVAPFQLTTQLLANDLIADGGSLIFLSSLSHFVGYPSASVYAATKDGVAHLSRSLRVALAAKQINAFAVYPGPTRTVHARRYSPDNSRENTRMLPETVADAIFVGMEKRAFQVIPGGGNKVMGGIGRLFPPVGNFAMKKAILDKLDDPMQS